MIFSPAAGSPALPKDGDLSLEMLGKPIPENSHGTPKMEVDWKMMFLFKLLVSEMLEVSCLFRE